MGTIQLDNNHALVHRSMGIVQYHQKRYHVEAYYRIGRVYDQLQEGLTSK